MTTFLRNKTRTSTTPSFAGTYHSIFDDSVISTESFVRRQGTEYMSDQGGNPRVNGKYVGGGFFRATKPYTIDRVPSQRMQILQAKDGPRYNTSVIATEPDRYAFDFTWNGNFNPLVYDADQYGAEAWDRARPAQPSFSLLNSIYELREWPQTTKPRILKYRDTKAWGDYYLAVNFGWIPILSDIRQFTQNLFTFEEQLKQLLRDEGKPVRRTFKMDSHSFSNSEGPVRGTSYGAFQSGMVIGAYAGVPSFEDTLTYSKDVWFSGRFRYHLPGGNRDWRWKRAMYLRIIAGKPSPATVWNAIPWTWLVDYFSNIGHIISNLDDGLADNLAADYAFLMQRKQVIYKRVSTGLFNKYGGGVESASAITRIVSSSKERTIVDPFGPAFSGLDDISPKQLSILGALGMSNFPSTRGRY